MAIGRTDERQNPLIPVAIIGRPVVWMSLADPIWASGQASRVKGRTHDRIRTNASILKTYLNPTGRPHMVFRRSADACAQSSGRFFKVNAACMPQGHPVIVQAGASEQGRELGAATAEVIHRC